MTPVIRISDLTYKRLQAYATPFVDTPASVVERILDEYEARHGAAKHTETPGASPPTYQDEPLQLDPDSPGSIRFTTILQGHIGGRSFSKWIELLREAHILALERVGSFDALKQMTLSGVAEGSKTGKGFKLVPEIGISIRGVDADVAWRHALHLARQLDVPIDILFEWQQDNKAAHPRKRGRLSWALDQSSETS